MSTKRRVLHTLFIVFIALAASFSSYFIRTKRASLIPNLGVTKVKASGISIHNIYPAWSPDGQKIAYVSDKPGYFQVFIINVDGYNETQLTNDAENKFGVTFSPNGKQIAYVTNIHGWPAVYTINLDGSNKQMVLEKAEDPKWSPDGTKIVVSKFIDDKDGEMCFFY
jgi:Tol biopolymer transport system component